MSEGTSERQDTLTRLDDLIVKLRKRLENAEQMRKILADTPEIFDLFVPDVARPSTNGTKTRQRVSQRSTRGGPIAAARFKKIAELFASDNFAGQTTATIADGIGAKRQDVTHILYRTHADLFQKERSPDNKLEVLWFLRKDWEEAMGNN